MLEYSCGFMKFSNTLNSERNGACGRLKPGKAYPHADRRSFAKLLRGLPQLLYSYFLGIPHSLLNIKKKNRTDFSVQFFFSYHSPFSACIHGASPRRITAAAEELFPLLKAFLSFPPYRQAELYHSFRYSLRLPPPQFPDVSAISLYS